MENLVENSEKVGVKFSSVAAIGDVSETELKLTSCKTFDKWKASCLFL